MRDVGDHHDTPAHLARSTGKALAIDACGPLWQLPVTKRITSLYFVLFIDIGPTLDFINQWINYRKLSRKIKCIINILYFQHFFLHELIHFNHYGNNPIVTCAYYRLINSHQRLLFHRLFLLQRHISKSLRKHIYLILLNQNENYLHLDICNSLS